jgi:hypothetical protein
MGELVVVVRQGKWQELLEATAELGLLIEPDILDGIMRID